MPGCAVRLCDWPSPSSREEVLSGRLECGRARVGVTRDALAVDRLGREEDGRRGAAGEGGARAVKADVERLVLGALVEDALDEVPATDVAAGRDVEAAEREGRVAADDEERLDLLDALVRRLAVEVADRGAERQVDVDDVVGLLVAEGTCAAP